jgi:hypothetical protein
MATPNPAMDLVSTPAPRRLRIDQIFARCENLRCTSRNRLWPSLQRRSSGICLDGQWYCGARCLERAVLPVFDGIVRGARRWKPKAHRVPLGLLLLSRGAIREDQLRSGLSRLRDGGDRPLGYWLQQIGAATEQDVTAALATQSACPVFPIEKDRSFLHCASLLPLPVLECARLLPVFQSRERNLLYMAFVDGIDYASLHVAERILGSATIPCIVTESGFTKALEEIRLLPRPELFQFDSVRESAEMARITASFALQLEARTVQIAGLSEFGWVRFQSETASRDLLFRLIQSA